MSIHYSTSKDQFTDDGLEALFLSVEWKSGQFPRELLKAMRGSHSVVSAWDGKKLVGLINALSDGVLTVYFHYVLVDPQYQGHGIGKELVKMMLHMYKGYQTKALIAYPEVVAFYRRLGFETEAGTVPLFISDLI